MSVQPIEPNNRLHNKVAIVTGGGSGFGRAISVRFAAEGARILIGDVNKATAEETAKQCKTETIVSEFNVTKEDGWRAAVDAALKKWGRIDIVVNNAGTSYKNTLTENVSEADYDKVMTVNVKSIFWSAQVCVPAIKKNGQEGGSMLNISSIGSVRPRPGLVWYNASKAAVSNATRGLAAEYGPNQIRINALCPLLSGTGLFESFVGVPFTEENVKKFTGQVPLGRLTDPADVANAAVYLCSDEGKFLTGVLLEIDGGKGI